MKFTSQLRLLSPALLVLSMNVAIAADNITLSDVPLFIVSPIKPNLMVILDNSQSMDATMEGKIISGDDTQTRGNIARRVLRNAINANQTKINWGLTTFETSAPALRDLYPYYMGDQDTMVFTNDCAAALAANTNRKGCIAIPGTPSGGFGFVTYSQSGDDPAINDVFYTDQSFPTVLYGTSNGGTSYSVYGSRNATQSWENANFGNNQFTASFTPTDAGFVPSASATPAVTRQVWIKRPGFGYRGSITGVGQIRRNVAPNSTTQISALIGTDGVSGLLKNEAQNTSTEIKNAALFTPLAGTINTVRDYFDNDAGSPITHTCQKNFVVLATDGVPTGRSDGSEYTLTERKNTKIDATTWNFGVAQRDVFTEIGRLRTTVNVAATDYDVKTYVIGMGESVVNESSIAALDKMASVGGTNKAFIGDNETNLAKAFEAIVNDVDSQGRGGSAVALNSGAFQTGSAVFQAKFKSNNWSGSLLSFSANVGGVLGNIATTPSWDAGALLKARVSARSIITYKPSATVLGTRGVPFRWPSSYPGTPLTSELDLIQSNEINKNAAGTTDNNGALRLAFLRGDKTNEPANCPACTPQFRDRADGPLGDIVNSAPVFVGAPAFGYANDFETAPYGTFAANNKDRKKVVYVGANDGMLHAFDAGNGAELFAYVPSSMYSRLTQLSNKNYAHRYFVDGTPTVGDVFYGSAWHTLLAAGMRGGAKGLFALDVTNPAGFTDEANAESIARWEFQDSADMGYVFGQPLLVKTNNGRWSVIVSGGYENASGNAVLFVIDAQNGSLVRKLDTGSGINNGLSGPAAIDTNGDGVVDVVYAGDLNGNLWKFDLTSSDESLWAVGNGSAALYAAGRTKPITSAPDVTRHPKGGYLISFGTGRYIDENDNSNFNPQSIYAVWDNLTNGTVTQAQLQQQTILDTTTSGGISFRLSSHRIGTPVDSLVTGDTTTVDRELFLTTKRGWFVNLPTSGERIVADVAFRSGRLIAVSMIPGTACDTANGSGWLMEFDAITGNRLDVVTFDINNDGKLTAALLSGDYLAFTISGTAGNNVSGRKIDGIPAGQTTVAKGGVLEDRLISTSKGTLEQITTGRGAGRDGRAMWREVR